MRPTRPFLTGSVPIILLASSLRIYHVSQRSLRLDEAGAADIFPGTAVETLALIRALHRAPIVHPLLIQTTEAVSTRPLVVRLPSLLASILTVCRMPHSRSDTHGLKCAQTLLGKRLSEMAIATDEILQAAGIKAINPVSRTGALLRASSKLLSYS